LTRLDVLASVGNDPNWSDGGPDGRYSLSKLVHRPARRRAAEASTRLARIVWRLAGVNRAGRRSREGGDPVSLFAGSTCPSQPIAPA
jgi:hypothetical protein